MNSCPPPTVELVRSLISGTIAAVAVPLFFLFSSYLLFFKDYSFATVLKKRSRSILLPYLLWNALGVLAFFTAQSIPALQGFFSKPSNIVANFGVIDYIDVFVGKFTVREPYPLMYQLWFLRDLFILVLLHKFIKRLADAAPFAFFALVSLLWILGAEIYVVSSAALFFFTLGLYIVKYRLDPRAADRLGWADLGAAYVAIAAANVTLGESFALIGLANILIGSLALWKLSASLVQNDKIYAKLKTLSGYSFWLYATHEPLLTGIKKASVKIIPMDTNLALVQYFGCVLLAIFISLLAGFALKRLATPVFAILTGNRS
ncbi:MAG: acyltransferase family protein [Helicobacteraceae bacterium]